MKKETFVKMVESIKKFRDVDILFLSDDKKAELWEPVEKIVEAINEELELEKAEHIGTDLDWWVWETDCGKKNYTAYFEDQEIEVKTPSDLWELIQFSK